MMKMRRETIVAAGFVFCLSAATSAFGALPSPGTVAPDFTLKSTAQKNLRLKEQRGKVMLINFWATWCGPCRQELPELDRIQLQFAKAGFGLFAVSVDEDARKAEAMMRQLGLKITVLHDQDKQVARRYAVDAMPATIIVDRKGVVRHVHRGYRAGYEKIYEKQIRELLRE